VKHGGSDSLPLHLGADCLVQLFSQELLAFTCLLALAFPNGEPQFINVFVDARGPLSQPPRQPTLDCSLGKVSPAGTAA
jgi:hypothetical protein